MLYNNPHCGVYVPTTGIYRANPADAAVPANWNADADVWVKLVNEVPGLTSQAYERVWNNINSSQRARLTEAAGSVKSGRIGSGGWDSLFREYTQSAGLVPSGWGKSLALWEEVTNLIPNQDLNTRWNSLNLAQRQDLENTIQSWKVGRISEAGLKQALQGLFVQGSDGFINQEARKDFIEAGGEISILGQKAEIAGGLGFNVPTFIGIAAIAGIGYYFYQRN